MKYIKNILVIPLFISLIMISSTKIKGNNKSMQIQIASSAQWIDGGIAKSIPQVSSGSFVPYGATVRMNFQLSNIEGSLGTQITFFQKEAMQFLPYYPGVLVINGRNATESEYSQSIESGMYIYLTPSITNISLDVQSIGTSKNRISTDMRITSNEVTQGQSEITFDFYYSGFYKLPQYHSIQYFNFYEELISSATLLENTPLSHPEIAMNGYYFIGFNTQKDGKGRFVSMGESIQESMKLYAVFDVYKFKVNYFVEGKLFATRLVEYGNNAEEIVPPNKESEGQSLKFVRWDHSLHYITNDINVYAIYEDQEIITKNGISISKIKKAFKNGTNELETAISKIFKYSPENVEEKKGKKGVKIEYVEKQKDNSSTFYSTLIVGAGILMVYGLFRKRK